LLKVGIVLYCQYFLTDVIGAALAL
jgi:hypothetical protein